MSAAYQLVPARLQYTLQHRICSVGGLSRRPLSELGKGKGNLGDHTHRLVTRIATKVVACTYAFSVNRLLKRPQGQIKDLWA
jgi:hypothetical protein